jgi:hypothetical protein
MLARMAGSFCMEVITGMNWGKTQPGNLEIASSQR